MLIKTFKFMVKDINAYTSKYDNVMYNKETMALTGNRDTSAALVLQKIKSSDSFDKKIITYKRIKSNEEKAAFSELRKANGDSYEKGDRYPITEHINFMLSSSFSAQIVAKYIDAIMTKYEVPKDEWADRVKIKTITGVDSKNGIPYIIYVCMFIGISYTGDITIKEFLNYKHEEESQYSDEFGTVTYYKVHGSLKISTPTINGNVLIADPSKSDVAVNVYITSYKSSGSIYKRYVLSCEQGKEYYSFDTVKEIIDGNVSTDTTEIEVPARGSIEFSIDNIALANQQIFNQKTSYQPVEISNMTPKNDVCDLQEIDNIQYLIIKDDKINLESNQ